MATLNSVIGIANCCIWGAISIYIVVTLIRKHRLTRFQWICLSNLWLAVGIVSIGMIKFNHIESDFCNFTLKIIYGIEIIILFNLSTVICYKAKCVCHDIYEFAINSNLPSEAFQRKKKIIIALIWGFSILYMLVYLILASIFIFYQG